MLPPNGALNKKVQRRPGNQIGDADRGTRTKTTHSLSSPSMVTKGNKIMERKGMPNPQLGTGREDRLTSSNTPGMRRVPGQ